MNECEHVQNHLHKMGTGWAELVSYNTKKQNCESNTLLMYFVQWIG